MATDDSTAMTPVAAVIRHLEWLEFALAAARDEETRRRERLGAATDKNREKRTVRLAEVTAEVRELGALVTGLKELQTRPAASRPAARAASSRRASSRATTKARAASRTKPKAAAAAAAPAPSASVAAKPKPKPAAKPKAKATARPKAKTAAKPATRRRAAKPSGPST